MGFGMSFIWAPMTTAVLNSVSSDKSGVASAVNGALREIGTAFGVALLGTLANRAYQDELQQLERGRGAACHWRRSASTGHRSGRLGHELRRQCHFQDARIRRICRPSGRQALEHASAEAFMVGMDRAIIFSTVGIIAAAIISYFLIDDADRAEADRGSRKQRSGSSAGGCRFRPHRGRLSIDRERRTAERRFCYRRPHSILISVTNSMPGDIVEGVEGAGGIYGVNCTDNIRIDKTPSSNGKPGCFGAGSISVTTIQNGAAGCLDHSWCCSSGPGRCLCVASSPIRFSLPGAESQRAYDLLAERFPRRIGQHRANRLQDRRRRDLRRSGGPRSRFRRSLDRRSALPHVASIDLALLDAPYQVSDDGDIAYATVNYDLHVQRAARSMMRPAAGRYDRRRQQRQLDGRRPVAMSPCSAEQEFGNTVRDRRHHRRGHHSADRLWLGRRHGSAHRDRPDWPDSSASWASSLPPLSGYRHLRTDLRVHDRYRCWHRLRALHRHPLPGRASSDGLTPQGCHRPRARYRRPRR